MGVDLPVLITTRLNDQVLTMHGTCLTHVYTHAYMHVCTYRSAHGFSCSLMNVSNVYTHVHAHVYMRMCICTCVMRVCKHVVCIRLVNALVYAHMAHGQAHVYAHVYALVCTHVHKHVYRYVHTHIPLQVSRVRMHSCARIETNTWGCR